MTTPAAAPTAARMSTRQAGFIGVGAMVGAGIFSLLGAAGEVAGAAVWISFVLAGIIAGFQGYSFAKLGAKFPSGAGMLEYVTRAFGEGHATAVTAWLVYAVNGIITAMVAISFGSYASDAFAGGDPTWLKIFAVAVVIVMTALNVGGSTVVARVQSAVVFVVVGILALFSVVTIANINPVLLDPAGYPSARHIASSVALTFFAFLGFGVVTFTAKDLANPAKQLPRAMTLAIGVAAVVYVAVALGVFGTLTVEQVIEAGPVAIAVAAQPVLGDAGYWLMAITALFATAGATNAGLYPLPGLCEHLARTGTFPPVMGEKIGGRLSVGLLIVSVAVSALVIVSDLSAVASLGSAVALIIFTFISIGHLRIRSQTGANTGLLVLAFATAGLSLLVFVFTTLLEEPASVVALIGLLVIAVLLDLVWGRARGQRAEVPA